MLCLVKQTTMSCYLPWTNPSPLKTSISNKRTHYPSSSINCSNQYIQNQEPITQKNSPRLILHDTLDAAGIDTKHARAAREGFCQQVGRMTEINGETSIAISRGADLARTALHIAAEDDSLISHSSVPLPVDAFVDRLDDLSMEFCSLYMPPSNSPPEVFFGNLERYFYVHKGFNRTNVMTDARALYLHSVLTCRSGSEGMLALIYSEMLKMLRVCGFLDFDAEIFFPHGLDGLPRGYHKLKSKLSDQPHVLTSKSLIVEILRNLKDAFWPFQYDYYSSLFMRAAHAANHIHGPSIAGEKYSESHSIASGLEIASTKAAQHRLGRGVWTNVRFGDMRRALAASERLIILTNDNQELRDYAILLYHCGYYKECLQNLKLYLSSTEGGYARQRSRPSQTNELEEDALEKLITRVILILGEEGWNKQESRKSYWGRNQEPW